nr:hypothetical protein [Lentzea californiensis]
MISIDDDVQGQRFDVCVRPSVDELFPHDIDFELAHMPRRTNMANHVVAEQAVWIQQHQPTDPVAGERVSRSTSDAANTNKNYRYVREFLDRPVR